MTSGVIVGVWGLISSIAIVLIGVFAWWGWSDPASSAVKWRSFKVAGAALSIIGLITGMFAFANTVREINEDARKYVFQRFLELKFNTSRASAIACAEPEGNPQVKNQCFDFSNLDGQVSFGILNSEQHFARPTNWQRNKELDPLISEIDRSIDDLNQAIDLASERPIVSWETRSYMGFIALVLFAAGLACNIGESVFQLRQELIRRRNTS